MLGHVDDTAAELTRAWIERYLVAWRTNDPGDIRALFTDDAEYRTAGWRDPHTGHDEIVRMWLGRPDEAGTWTFSWRTIGIDGRRAFVQGETTYPDEVYANLWVIELADDGRARSFTEWWMDEGAGDPD